MNKKYSGVCPVMLTPFTEDDKIDYEALKKLTSWYIESGASALFAVCQSSEMFYLSVQERIEYAEFVKRISSVPVFAVGNVESDINKALNEINSLIKVGVDGIVFITNTICEKDKPSSEWKKKLQIYLDNIPEGITLGLYECPIPYKHLITDDELRFIVNTKRFAFLKDTCCDSALIKKRLEIIGDEPLSLYNANSTTLLDTLKMGSAGFCGILANFNTKLCVWLCENWNKNPKLAEYVQSVLSVSSKFGDTTYPVNAKEFLKNEGIMNTIVTRSNSADLITDLVREDLKELSVLFKCTEEIISNQ